MGKELFSEKQIEFTELKEEWRRKGGNILLFKWKSS